MYTNLRKGLSDDENSRAFVHRGQFGGTPFAAEKVIGYVPREDMRRIEDRLDADDRQIKAVEDAAWKKSDPEADARKSSFEEQLNAQLKELDDKIAAESDPAEKAKLEAEKATKEQWLNAIK